MVIMPDNWPLGTRQVSYSGICCLDGSRGKRVTEQRDRHVVQTTTQRKEKSGKISAEGENKD